MFKNRFKRNEIRIIVYGQYLLNYETPIKENASRLIARRQTKILLITFTMAGFFTQVYLLLKLSKHKI